MTKMMIAAGVVALLSTPALADQIQTAYVGAGQVDFANRAQVQALYAKINAAAREVCSLNSPNPTLAGPEPECIKQAVANAVRRVNRPVLTAVYEDASARGALATNDQ